MNNSSILADVGVGLVKTIISGMGHIFRELPTQDHGIDGEIELIDGDKATGRLVAVQIKTGQSYLKNDQGGKFVQSIRARHYEYWVDHSLPVILVLCDEKKWNVLLAACLRGEL